ncbi:hypothetical protein L2734_08315 [Parashewanella spongiae]|uniref:hypothetical protein n=1 Tax=Parashewanella spongiae TaxID=342950 RepID=UPI001A9F864E|nr:hypothetical protein [Parashewanella spongiae]MCL1078181.1 hypothetical protein [Parashewanella spongiae]
MQFKVFKRRIKNTLFGNADNSAVEAQLKSMADARYGAMYFLAKTDMAKVSISLPLVDSFVINTEPLTDAKNFAAKLLKKSAAGKKFVSGVSVIGEATSAVIEKIKGMLSNFFHELIEKVKSVHGAILGSAEWVTEFGMFLVSEFAGDLSSLIPGLGYLQSAADIYSGVKQAILKSKDLVTQLYAGRGVELLGGHPSIIANALARHSITGIAGGVKSTALGMTSIGLEAAGDAAGGAGSIVSLVTGILERIVDALDRLVQFALVKRVLNKASKEWDRRGDATALINNHKEFSYWFQNVVVTTPVIAAMVMGSGFVAHPQKFLQLLSSGDALNNPDVHKKKYQEKYDKGVSYIEKLKSLSGSYVQDYIDGYGIAFTSKDGIVNARLDELTGGKALLDGHEFAVIPEWAIKTPEQRLAAGLALSALHDSEAGLFKDSRARQASAEATLAGMNP